jgi:hypothetical protein
MMTRQLLMLFLCSQFSFAQIYTNNAHLKGQKVSGQWRSGAIVTEAGKTLEGEVRGFSYKANDVSSFRFRKEKGAETVTYKADDCKQFDHPQDPLELHNSSEKKNISKSWRDGLPHFTKTGVKVLSLLTDSFPGNC